MELILWWRLPNSSDFTSSAAAFYMFWFGLSFFGAHTLWALNHNVAMRRAALFSFLNTREHFAIQMMMCKLVIRKLERK